MAHHRHVADKANTLPNKIVEKLVARRALWAHEEFKKDVFLCLYPDLYDIIPKCRVDQNADLHERVETVKIRVCG